MSSSLVHDEIDFLSTVDSTSFYACSSPSTLVDGQEESPAPSEGTETRRRSLRARRPVVKLAPSVEKARKRTISTSGIDTKLQKLALKKIKLDEKKAVRNVFYSSGNFVHEFPSKPAY